MIFKYRVIGRVRESFVLRGMLFKASDFFDFCVADSELDFVKSNCEVKQIISLEQEEVKPVDVSRETIEETKIEIPAEPVLEVKKQVEPVKKGGTNGKQQNQVKSNVKNKAKV